MAANSIAANAARIRDEDRAMRVAGIGYGFRARWLQQLDDASSFP
jgi:hypothetical protein